MEENQMEVRSNPDLTVPEKETIIIINSETVREDGMINIHSDHIAIIRYLLNLPDAEIKHKEIKKIDGEKFIVGIMADIPIGHFKLRNRKRGSNKISRCVS